MPSMPPLLSATICHRDQDSADSALVAETPTEGRGPDATYGDTWQCHPCRHCYQRPSATEIKTLPVFFSGLRASSFKNFCASASAHRQVPIVLHSEGMKTPSEELVIIACTPGTGKKNARIFEKRSYRCQLIKHRRLC